MDESVSPVMLLYGLAVIVAMGKACTLFVWRTFPKPRPPLRQEMIEAWQRRKARVRAAKEPVHEPQEASLNPNPTDGVTSK
jgi:cytochrome b561